MGWVSPRCYDRSIGGNLPTTRVFGVKRYAGIRVEIRESHTNAETGEFYCRTRSSRCAIAKRRPIRTAPATAITNDVPIDNVKRLPASSSVAMNGQARPRVPYSIECSAMYLGTSWGAAAQKCMDEAKGPISKPAVETPFKNMAGREPVDAGSHQHPGGQCQIEYLGQQDGGHRTCTIDDATPADPGHADSPAP